MAVLDKFKKKKIQGVDDTEYLTLRDERRISKENAKITREFERNKARKNVPESEYLSQMRDSRNVVEFDDLHTYFYTDIGTVKAVDGVTYDVPQGTTVGIVGESGCGKSVTSLSLMQLVQAPQGQIVSGEIRYLASDGKCYNIAKMPRSEMLHIRGKEISMIFQEPMTSLNPVFTIGEQMDEVVLLHEEGATAESAKAHSIEMLQLVGIAMPDKVYASYPHELSGGMRQRVMIAMALSCGPRLIIADEPTTALDVTIQAQILELMKQIQKDHGTSIILITHDLGIVADMADRIVIMYAGRIVERGTFRDIFYNPAHPYTWGLLGSVPRIDTENKSELMSIKGTPPDLHLEIKGCPFCARCKYAMDVCTQAPPERFQVGEQHFTNCWLQHPYAPTVENPITGRDAKLHE